MQKQILRTAPAESQTGEEWLDVASIASVELTSEDPRYPIEDALATSGDSQGWRASEPGVQTVRLVFREPQQIRRMQLEFREDSTERMQEFAIAYGTNPNAPLQELRRQQWTFSPGGSRRELEDYNVALDNVTVLQLSIDPDRGAGTARASLRRWLVG